MYVCHSKEWSKNSVKGLQNAVDRGKRGSRCRNRSAQAGSGESKSCHRVLMSKSNTDEYPSREFNSTGTVHAWIFVWEIVGNFFIRQCSATRYEVKKPCKIRKKFQNYPPVHIICIFFWSYLFQGLTGWKRMRYREIRLEDVTIRVRMCIWHMFIISSSKWTVRNFYRFSYHREGYPLMICFTFYVFPTYPPIKLVCFMLSLASITLYSDDAAD